MWRLAVGILTLFLINLVAIGAFLATAAVAAGENAAARSVFVTPGKMRSGALLLKSENAALASEASGQRGNSIVRADDTRPEAGSSARDRYVEAPLTATDVDLVVSGPTARARVTQIFHNPTDGWVEAVYVYPLPPGAAVDTLKMVIGERIVVGDIKDRKSARDVYEQAKSTGQKASLIEQERPNIFTNSVANIGPRETVVVQIEYQEPVRQSGNEFSLRVPLVVAPRYIPDPIVQTVDLRDGGAGWGKAADQVVDPVPDRDRISPPVLDPRKNPPVNPVAITVRLQAGFPLAEVKSHHHTVTTETVEDGVRIIKLADGAALSLGFQVSSKSRSAGTAPSASLMTRTPSSTVSMVTAW